METDSPNIALSADKAIPKFSQATLHGFLSLFTGFMNSMFL